MGELSELIERNHVGHRIRCTLCADTDAELRKLREENASMRVALAGLLGYHDKCGMASTYAVYAHEVLASLPKSPEVG